jgi:site-specific recombinase XerD
MTGRSVGPVLSSLLTVTSDLATAIGVPEVTVARLLRIGTLFEAGGRAKNTVRALRSDLATWHRWCRANAANAFPARSDSVASFVHSFRPRPTDAPTAGRKGSARKTATVRRYVASISALHRAAKLNDPTKDDEVRTALRALASAWADAGESRPRQAAALTDDAVKRILRVLGESLIDRRDRALLLTARDLLARRSELVDLRIEDRADLPDGAATIRIRRSKTDQSAQGAECYLRPNTVRAIDAWLEAANLSGTKGVLFRSVNNRGARGNALHAQKVPGIFKKLASRAHLERHRIDIALVSGHSCRVGMAQDLVENGAELPEVMHAGRWRSAAMVARYTERLQATKGAVARLHAKEQAKARRSRRT